MTDTSPPSRARAGERRSATRDWIDPEEYPFDPNYAELGPGRLHYVDEGEGRPLVFLHGNPTWSFVYRHLIRGLSEEVRCVAPDLFGFGLSDKPDWWSYKVRDHAAVVEEFVENLDLSDVTLVVQDWGGPTGLDYAAKHPETVDSLVLLNSAAWPLTEYRRLRAFSRAMDTPIVSLLDRRYNVPIDWVMPRWFGDRSKWTPTLQHHYRTPLAEPSDRRGALTFTRELLDATPFLTDLWGRRDAIAGTPALLCWGMQGPVFGTESLRRFQGLFPDARTVAFPSAGHFVQEEKPDAVLKAVRTFLAERRRDR